MNIAFTATLSDRVIDRDTLPPPPRTFSAGVSGFSYEDLRDVAQLPRLMDAFDDFARAQLDPALWERFVAYRQNGGEGTSPEEVSEVLVATAPVVSAFLAKLFGVEAQVGGVEGDIAREGVIFEFKREFVKKRTARRKRAEIEALSKAQRVHLDEAARAALSLATGAPDQWNDEREVAQAVLPLLHAEELFRKAAARGGVVATDDHFAKARKLLAESRALPELSTGLANLPAEVAQESDAVALYASILELVDRWCLLRMVDHDYDHHWVSLRLPRTLDPQHLVPLLRAKPELPEAITGAHARRERDGFALTDRRADLRGVMNEVDYCLYCHDRGKDSCSKGMRNKDGSLKANALGIPLTGCPLDEKISEAHLLKQGGKVLAALAVIMVDNPMVPGTGHRICNDCMKACIFQKQEPVNIPQIETSILTDVLGLPWGFEIYDLLTRWNPLRARRPYALPYNGKNALVVGLGPAGYTLAHYLWNEGFGVAGIDGLKIEPLPPELLTQPWDDFRSHYVELQDRVLLGFGGVSEYGITVRWDKNFLTLVYVSLARREHMAIYGGVRFGGTIDLDDAWQLGFHHVAIAAGAGKPTLVDIPNGLIRGIRQASDFLMALQLTGAYKRSALANLTVRLPAIVIGGGLTGIDTATELRAYYVVQVEKVLERHETLCRELGEATALRAYTPEELEVLTEQVAHGKLIREERERAHAEGREPHFNALLDAWGGVSLAYRRTINDSPAYRLNHEEIEKFLEEGVTFVEQLSPKEAVPDQYGAVKAMRFDRMTMKDGKLVASGEVVELPARTVCIAAGTAPNVTYERELPGAFVMNAKTKAFQQHRVERGPDGVMRATPDDTGFFTSHVGPDGQVVSFYGDNHPVYAGSVVKAMASARDGYGHVVKAFAGELAALDPHEQPTRDAAWVMMRGRLDDQLTAVVHEVRRLTPTIVEVVVRAPLASRKFNPGQFYRLQNFEMYSYVVDGTRLAMEGLAMTGAWTDPEKGLLSMIALEMGASSKLIAALRVGEPVVVMGPTGAPTEIPKGERVVLCGGGLGNAVLFSIGKALRANGNQVIYFAGYKNPADLFRVDDIEASADQVIWTSDVGPAIPARRPQDRSFVGNMVQAMIAYARGDLGPQGVDLAKCERLIAIGSDRMMAAVKAARHEILKPYLKPGHLAIGSINSPMQCMMKEICAQCLQRHVDPVTGKVSVVFTCFNQDQELDRVDFPFLNDRLKQSGMQEKLSSLWLERLLKIQDIPRI
ncbi:MAG: FAD-dependent oxidoreductase [Deltaproteobacteria bacterium]|nr:FAD-dependent oxidoreductase [Myxococcales bacterium]MDP3212854.1 FAD-dependent oxidoreductase [Deltaproteobacteria bacterium]